MIKILGKYLYLIKALIWSNYL